MPWKGILKFFVIGFLGLMLSIALVLVRETVSERSQRREQVYSDMALTTAGSQVVAGPFLVLPYEVTTSKQESSTHSEIILPRDLVMSGRLQTEKRYRSLYEILLYGTQVKLEGSFEFAEPRNISVPQGSTLRWLEPYLVVMVQDNRGLTRIPVVSWAGKNFEVKPGNGGLSFGIDGGFHSDLPTEIVKGGTFAFAVDLSLQGMQTFSWVPVGEKTRVKLEADWPHPSFQGRALPREHEITKSGFEAVWESTQFSSNIAQLIQGSGAGTGLQNQGVGVRLVQPVDVYLQAERSVKYGFLFIAVTFGAFLLFENLKRLSIHPVQYGLVGLALVLFYVLLLALSEHIAFVWAYVVAGLASMGLLGFYVRYVVQSWKNTVMFTGVLGILYAVVYGILMSEDYALLYGACLLFVLLATAMVATRRVK
ncbi:MAG TPA: cell envelope integrity protein CreD [Oligoflexus sp.]|uniref:cell envelope integrity protein CreD n=1 Tax=Oligoflexus sp. TaxID=1971216 RepID=UPI002D7FDB1E|nr:cell envelope integrity protein CreD [Oligoflexus sp.]HET9237375.1 cell envelope integrity protein CreD [Oligoflexus sp.]